MTVDERSCVDVAASIAEHLCRSAFSFAGECTWMGTTQDLDEDSQRLEFTYQTLGPDLYGGTSGISLFLAEVWARTQIGRYRRVAEEGIAFALQRVHTIPKEHAVSLYLGTVGIAYAAARVGQLTGRIELLQRAREVLQQPFPQSSDDVLLDVVAGAAGGAPALLLLSQWLGSAELEVRARELGRHILDGATRGEHGWSWGVRAGGFEAARDLTGFAHGAAGMGWALLELYRHFHDAEFLHGAKEAFRYENTWFQVAQDNWPDFRESDGVDEPAPCRAAWCHGAPGIALSRIRALEVMDAAEYRRDVDAALRTTRHSLTAPSDNPAGDFSLCHGRAGLADVLLVASDAGVYPDGRSVALSVAADATARWGDVPGAWPCGVQRGSNPSLMLGLAGIGHFYLRCDEAAPPSVLCVGAGA